MKIILAGKKDRAVACLDDLIKNNYQIAEIITPPKDGHGYWSPSLTSVAKKNNIPIFAPKNINSQNSISHIKKIKPDIIILSSYTQIIKSRLLSIPSYGFINLHGGKLPEYRGSSTLNWMIINGEKEGGISIIKVDKGIDTGAVLAQEKFLIKSEDDIVSITKKTLKLFPKMLLAVLENIENGTIKETLQNVNKGNYYYSRNPKDGRIFWENMTDKEVFNFVRALVKPLPGAFSFYGSKKILIWGAEILKEEIKGRPGEIVKFINNNIVVVAKNRGVLLKNLEAKNRKVNPRIIFKIGDSFK